jgi:hypothetical protein
MVIIASPWTHPADATLGHPLFRKRKRGLTKSLNPLSAEGEERVGKRSDAGVSKSGVLN